MAFTAPGSLSHRVLDVLGSVNNLITELLLLIKSNILFHQITRCHSDIAFQP